jgi:uncharacterized membrane protein (UPF0127 family)
MINFQRLILFSIFAFPLFAQLPYRDEYFKLPVGGDTLHLEIANTDSLRTQGLSDRPNLAQDHGLLFVFPDTSYRVFWMVRCFFPIEVGYINPQGIIRDIIVMPNEPLNTPPQLLRRYRSSRGDIKYALEVNPGWFGRHKLKTGDRLELGKYRAKE